MQLAAERLIDWKTAQAVGERVAGDGLPLSSIERARVREDFADVVPLAERMVSEFTSMIPEGPPARAWVQSRGEWLGANLRAFERVMEPFAAKVLPDKAEHGALIAVRRKTIGAELGALLGYLSRKVLGQYDLFTPADDEGVIYLVGANVVGVERRYRFPERDFRLWISLHEAAHRVQFAGVPWLRGHLSGLIDSYLGSIDLDPKRIVTALMKAVEDVRAGNGEWRGYGWIFVLMTPEQQDIFRRMQSIMALLEGHGNYVMDAVARDRMPQAAKFRQTLHERRNKPGMEKAFQKVIGFDTKVRQYDIGERFVAKVVETAGMSGFNRVWAGADNLPTLEEISQPELWVARVGAI